MAYKATLLVVLIVAWLAIVLADQKKFLLITYNVEKRSPSEIDPRKFLQVTKEPQPDLLAVGFQEIDVKPSHFFGISRADPWSSMLEPALQNAGYQKLERIRMMGLVMIVYARPTMAGRVRNLEASSKTTATGASRWFSGKGGVVLSFEYNGRSVVLVNSHLYPHDDHYNDRIANYWTITQTKLRRPMLQHDLVLWMGDLNFRINGFSISDVIDRTKQGANSTLVNEMFANDQLSQAIREEKAFNGFLESKPAFLPTYKFIVGTVDNYDSKRKPAWTDRIVHKIKQDENNNPILGVKQDEYEAHFDYTGSDHKPVSSTFLIDFPEELA